MQRSGFAAAAVLASSWGGLLILTSACRNGGGGSAVQRAEVLAGSNDVSPLGQAYQGATKRLLNLACVEGTARSAGGEVGELSFARNLTSSQINDKLNAHASIGATIDFVTLTPQMKTAVAHAASDYADTITFTMSGTAQTLTFEASSLKVSGLGANYIKNFNSRLADLCGSEFINQIHYGASLIATVKLTFLDRKTHAQFSGGLQVDLAGGILSASGTLAQMSSEQKRDVNVQIQVDQHGGDPLGLQTLLGDLPLSCNFDDMQQCFNTMAAVLKYARGPFHDSLLAGDAGQRTPWQVQSYTTKSYIEAGLIELAPGGKKPAALPAAASDALTSLQASYASVVEHLTLAQLMRQNFAGLVAGTVFAQISALDSSLRGQLAAIPAVQQQCYADPGSCPAYVTAFQQQLAQLDASLLTQVQAVTSAGEVTKSQLLGAQGGQAFDDSTTLSAQRRLTGLNLYICSSDAIVTATEAAYSDHTTITHGGRPGPCVAQAVDLSAGGPSRVTLYLGSGGGIVVISGMKFEWSGGAAKVFGKTAGSSLVLDTPQGYTLGGFFGQEGSALDGLGLVYTRAPQG